MTSLSAPVQPCQSERQTPQAFTRDVLAFCAAHERVFVVEQNRDGQMRALLMTEANVPGPKLIAALRNLDNKRDRNPPKKHGNIPL